MGIENFNSLNKGIYNKLTFDDVTRHFPKDHPLLETFKPIFNYVAGLNGDASTIDQTELQMLQQLMAKHDTDKNGSIDDKDNNNELENFTNDFNALLKSNNVNEEVSSTYLRLFMNHMIDKTERFKNYEEGLIEGFPKEAFSSAIKENYTEAETKNLKDIYRFFSDDKTEDGSYSDFENSSMDRRSYINLGWMANKYLKGKEANPRPALEQMLTAMKQQAGGMLDNCTVEDLQNFLAVEDNYSNLIDDPNKFQVRKNEVFHPVSVTEDKYKETNINYNLSESLDDNFDGHVTQQEFNEYNRFIHDNSRYGANVQLRGECFFDASVNALGRSLADPVFDDKNGVVTVSIEGIIDPKTKKPITVNITYEELAARKSQLKHNQQPKILIYGMAVEKLFNSGTISQLRAPEEFRDDVLSNIKSTEQYYYNQISNLITELSSITDPAQKKAKFTELSNQINDILNDPKMESYTTLINNLKNLKEQMSLVCVDNSPLDAAVKKLTTEPNNAIAQNTIRNISQNLRNISNDITSSFSYIPADKAQIEKFEQLLENFASRNINDEVSKSSNPQILKILTDYNNAKTELQQLKNCNTISGTIDEFKKTPKNINIINAIESHYKNIDAEASNAETPQEKNKALQKINTFLNKLKSLNSNEYIIENTILQLETTKEFLINPSSEILEIIEDDIELETTEITSLPSNWGERRTYVPFEELNIESFTNTLNNSIDYYRTQTDADIRSEAYQYESKNSYGLIGIEPLNNYNDITNGGLPIHILNLLSNKEIKLIEKEGIKNYSHDMFRGATLSLRGNYGKLLGYAEDKQNSGHAVSIVSSSADAIQVYDTNTGKTTWIPKSALIGENIRSTILQVGKTERNTYI